MEQGTEEWKLARLGKVTASRVSDARAKAGTATRANYIADIITERLTGSPIESFTNAYIERKSNFNRSDFSVLQHAIRSAQGDYTSFRKSRRGN